MLSSRQGTILAVCLAVGVTSAVVLAKNPPQRTETYRAAVDASDDPFGMTAPSPTNTAPPVNAPPTNGALMPSTNAAPAPEPVVSPVPLMPLPTAVYVARNLTGDARHPIQINARKQVHAALTINLSRKLTERGTVTLEEHATSPDEDEAPRPLGRYLDIKSTIDARSIRNGTIRITYVPQHVKDAGGRAVKLAIAVLEDGAEDWRILRSIVDTKRREVAAAITRAQLTDGLFALVAKP